MLLCVQIRASQTFLHVQLPIKHIISPNLIYAGVLIQLYK